MPELMRVSAMFFPLLGRQRLQAFLFILRQPS